MLLLVEDEPMICIWAADILREAGFFVMEIGDGDTAIAELDHIQDLDGLITDIKLPGTASGWDVARHARQCDPHVPIMYMTGDSAADLPAEGVANSILLQKPFAAPELLAAISTVLRSVADVPIQPSRTGM